MPRAAMPVRVGACCRERRSRIVLLATEALLRKQLLLTRTEKCSDRDCRYETVD